MRHMRQLIYVTISGAFIAGLAVSFAIAQQLPSQVAIQIDGIINQWAMVIEAQQKEIADLKVKCGDPCKDEKK